MRDSDWQIIVTLHTERNITKTAELLFLTQSALTKRIQLIEKELGRALMIRTTKGITFTPEGEFVAERAREILQIIGQVHEYIAVTNVDGGVIKLGVPNSYARFVLPSLVKRYSTLHQNVRLDVTTIFSNEILVLLENRELQAGFVRGDSNTRLNKHLFSEEQVHIVSKEPINLEDLPHLPRIDYSKEHTIVKNTNLWWKEWYDQPPLVRMTVNNGDTCREMILKGLGYGIFPEPSFVTEYPELPCVPLFHRDGTPFTRKTWFVYHKDELQKKVFRDFVHFVEALDIHELLS